MAKWVIYESRRTLLVILVDEKSMRFIKDLSIRESINKRAASSKMGCDSRTHAVLFVLSICSFNDSAVTIAVNIVLSYCSLNAMTTP